MRQCKTISREAVKRRQLLRPKTPPSEIVVDEELSIRTVEFCRYLSRLRIGRRAGDGNLIATGELVLHPVAQRLQKRLARHLVIGVDLRRTHPDPTQPPEGNRVFRRRPGAAAGAHLVKI